MSHFFNPFTWIFYLPCILALIISLFYLLTALRLYFIGIREANQRKTGSAITLFLLSVSGIFITLLAATIIDQYILTDWWW